MSFHWSSCLNPSLLFGRQHCMTCFSRVVPLSCSHATNNPLLRGNFFLRDIDVRLSNRSSSSDYSKRFLLIVGEPVVISGGLILIWRDSYTARRVHAFIITYTCYKKDLIRVKRRVKVGVSIRSRMRG